MQTFFVILGTVLGMGLGFAIGLLSLLHITKGHNIKALLNNSSARRYLGLLGWLFAIAGGYAGYKITRMMLGI